MNHSDATSQAWQEANQAANELRRALRSQGLSLPNLAVDMSAATAGYPLVTFGTAPAETALRLAKLLNQISDPGND